VTGVQTCALPILWLLRYLRELFVWAFRHWRMHQALLGLVIVLAGLLGVARFSIITPARVSEYLLCWLVFLTFVVAPARLWRANAQRLKHVLTFIEHPDDYSCDVDSSVEYFRVTVKNPSPAPLTNVEVRLAEIEPRPDDFITLDVPLRPMYAPAGHAQFTLSPGAHRSINLISLYVNEPYGLIPNAVTNAALKVPVGVYRVKIVASANETVPATQWATLTLERGKQWPQLQVQLDAVMQGRAAQQSVAADRR